MSTVGRPKREPATMWAKKPTPDIRFAKYKPQFTAVGTHLFHKDESQWKYVFLIHTKGRRSKDTRYIVFAPSENYAKLIFYRYHNDKPKARYVEALWFKWSVTRLYYQTLQDWKNSFDPIRKVLAEIEANITAVTTFN